MGITVLITCIKTGRHLNDNISSIARGAQSAGVPVPVKILTPLPTEAFDDLPQEDVSRLDLEIVPVDPSTGMMGKFDSFLGSPQNVAADEIYVFSNDDVIFSGDFFKNLAKKNLDGMIAGPVIYHPDGQFQMSLFRKQFSFWRLMFRVHDGGLYSRFVKHPTALDETLNSGRKTVDGCCFIINGATIEQIGGKFDFCAFLYMEEVLFQYYHDKYEILVEVQEDLCVIHLGGTSLLTHQWTKRRSQTVRDSVSAVSRAYLGLSPVQTSILRSYYAFEGVLRTVLGNLSR